MYERMDLFESRCHRSSLHPDAMTAHTKYQVSADPLMMNHGCNGIRKVYLEGMFLSVRLV
jgi:hypothetical protein